MGINKKIAVVCNYELLPDRVGGMDNFFWMFDEKCKENNITVDWFFPNTSTHGKYADLNIISSNYQEVEHFFASYIIINPETYTSITTHFVELCSPVFKKIKQVSNAKIIAVDHNPRPLYGYSLLKQIKKRAKGILYSKYIDLFVGVSNYTANEIIKDFGSHLKSKIKTIYNGVLLKEITPRENQSRNFPHYLVVSHLRKSKGIQDLIEAVHKLSIEVLNNLRITIYGDGPFKEELLKKIALYKLENTFDFKGSVSNIKELYCHYDYLLQPTHMECFSLSILESLAANVPVITTNVGGNEEAITNTENGFIYKAKDINALKNLLENSMNSNLKIATNTRILIEKKFSIEKMVADYFSLLL